MSVFAQLGCERVCYVTAISREIFDAVLAVPVSVWEFRYHISWLTYPSDF
jgi:hypothetical protein